MAVAPEELEALIAGGKSFTVEFKGEERRPLSDDELVEAIVCLANGKGGTLLVGVEDDGRVTGARPRHEAHVLDPARIQALIANRTRPSLSCRVDIAEFDGKKVVIVAVPEAPLPVGTTEGTYVRRAILGREEPGCLPYHFHEMQARQADRGQLDYSALVLPDATWDDFDPLEFERLRRIIRESRGYGDRNLLTLPDVEIAKALGAVEANHEVVRVRVLGLLLFGREEAIRRRLPTHEVAFQVLADTRVEVNEFFRWPLLRAMEEILSRFRARNREEELMLGTLRIGVPEYSERAFREALANALNHRDYSRLGAVYVQWYPDRIEVSNPGSLPEGVRLDNLLVTPPRPRNPLLADAFKRAGLVERTGRGIDTIFYEQVRNGRPAPSYERSNETSVVLVLPGGKASLEFVRLVAEEDRIGTPLGLDELLLLNQTWLQRRLGVEEASRLIQEPYTQARAVLERLIERGLIESRGEGRHRTYHLSPAVYRRLGKQAAYVRTRGLEAARQEQMVLQYLQKYGKITRREVTERCRVTSSQARSLLKRLRDRGAIEQVGERRAAYYILGAKNMDRSKRGMDRSK